MTLRQEAGFHLRLTCLQPLHERLILFLWGHGSLWSDHQQNFEMAMVVGMRLKL